MKKGERFFGTGIKWTDEGNKKLPLSGEPGMTG